MKFSFSLLYYNIVLKNPRMILCFLLMWVCFFGYHAENFKLDASADSLLLEDDADLKLFRKIHQRYPANELLIVTFSIFEIKNRHFKDSKNQLKNIMRITKPIII